MRDRITPITVIFTIVLLLGGYVGSYYALVEVGAANWVNNIAIYEDEYRIDGQATKIFYWPANQIDRQVRSRMWKFDAYELIQ